MSRFKELTTCIACMDIEDHRRHVTLDEKDLNILDYLLHPFSKAYLKNLKNKNNVRICVKCRCDMSNVDKFRNLVLKNGLLLFNVAEFQEEKAVVATYTHNPLENVQASNETNKTAPVPKPLIEIMVPVKTEHLSPDTLLNEEIDIKFENDNTESVEDERDSELVESTHDRDDNTDLDTSITVKEETAKQYEMENEMDLSKTIVHKTQTEKQPINYHTYNPTGLPVLGMTWSNTPSQNRYLNPSLILSGHGANPRPQKTQALYGSFLPLQGQRIVFSPQVPVPTIRLNTAGKSGVSQPTSQTQPVQLLRQLFFTVKTVPGIPQQNTANKQPSNEMKTVNEVINEMDILTPGPSKKKKRRKRVSYRDMPPKFVCSECGKKYRSKNNLIIHVEHVHMGIKVKCSICDRDVLKHNLKTHMRQHEDAVYCQPCDKWYSPIRYKVHVTYTAAHIKPEEYRFTCHDCGEKFHQKIYLRRHINRVHLKAEKEYKCSLCPAAFEERRGLTKHVTGVHDKRERPRNYMCDICGVGMYDKKSLSAHMVRHTGARPFKCKICAATFGYNGALFTHNKLIHENKRRTKKKEKKGKRKVKVEKDD